MPDKQKPVMDTAICSSITRAAGLGDTFWRANLRDVAVMAMSSDQNQSLNRPSGKGKAVTPGMARFFLLFLFHLILYFKHVVSCGIFSSCQLERR